MDKEWTNNNQKTVPTTLKNNFLLIKLIWKALGKELTELHSIEIDGLKPFSRHYLDMIFGEVAIPPYIRKKYNKYKNFLRKIGIDEKYFNGEKAFEPDIVIDDKKYSESCEEYWSIKEKINLAREARKDRTFNDSGNNEKELKDNEKKIKERLEQYAKILVKNAEEGEVEDSNLFNLIMFLKSGKAEKNEIYKLENIISNLQKINLEHLVKADIELLEEYKKILTQQYNLTNVAITLLKTDKEELKNCLKALYSGSK